MIDDRARKDHGADVALLKRVVAREEDAVAELYDRHSRLLYGLILRILRDRHEAEDVLQEVFVAVWRRAATYDASMGSPVGWLVGVARNRAIDHLRARSASERVLESVLGPEEVTDNPESAASRSEDQQSVRQALRQLPAEQRELIEHAYFLGLTQSELAARFGLPLGTVKTRIRTGMLTLRTQLSGHD